MEQALAQARGGRETESIPMVHPRQATPPTALVSDLEDPCANAPTAPRGARRVADAVVDGLVALGVEHAFGVFGRALAPLADALLRSPIQVLHTRHESGAAFAALEASLIAERPCLVVTTTGPGITNALTGLVAARWEGARVILLSPATSADRRGRAAFQETSPETLPPALFGPGPVFHDALLLETPAGLPTALRRLAAGLAAPGGFVAHLSVPVTVQGARWGGGSTVVSVSRAGARCDPAELPQCSQQLRSGPAAIWVGFGARHAAEPLLRVAEALGAPVLATPRAKGIFPERHALYLGVTGLGGHARVSERLAGRPPDHTLVLGTCLGEYSSLWAPELRPREGFIMVDPRGCEHGVGFPEVPTRIVQADIGAFLRGLLDPLKAAREKGKGTIVRDAVSPWKRPAWVSGAPDCVHPAALFDALQRHVVDASDAPVFTEAGNAFAWGSQALCFDEPGRYRTSMGWGSMGAAAAGVLGAALARPGKAVAVVGDGALLMQNELSTAVRYDLPVVWVVLNDGQYGMVHHGMRLHGLHDGETTFHRVDFSLLGRAVGASGMRVSDEARLGAAFRAAMAARGPFVVDVLVDSSVPPPVITPVRGSDAPDPRDGRSRKTGGRR